MPEYVISIVAQGKDRGASSMLGNIGGMLGRIAEFALGNLLAGGIRRIAGALGNLTSQAVGSASQLQGLHLALETLAAREMVATGAASNIEEALDSVGGTVDGLTGDLRQLAIISPFEFQQVADTFRLNMAFGASAESAIDLTKAILDTGAGMGLTSEMMGRLNYNLGQALVAGDLTGVNLRQIRIAGLDLAHVLESQLGRSLEDVRADLASGALEMGDVAEAFTKYAEENFGGAAERMSRTFAGLQSSIRDVFFFAGADLLTPALEEVTKFLGTIFDQVLAFIDSGALVTWGEQFGAWIGTFLEKADNVLSFFGNIRERAAETGNALREQFLEKFGGILEALQYNLNLFSAWWTEHGPAIREMAKEMLTRFLAAGEKLAAQVLPWIQEELLQFGAWFEENGPLIAEFAIVVSKAFTWIVEAAMGAFPIISAILDFFIDELMLWAELIMQIVTGEWADAWETAKELVAVTFGEHLPKIFTTFFDWILGWFGFSWPEAIEAWAGVWNQFLTIVTAIWEDIKSTIGKAIDWLIEKIKKLIDKIRGAKLHGDLMGESPSPLERSLLGIGDAMRQISAIEMPRLAGAMGGGGRQNTYNWQPTINTSAPAGDALRINYREMLAMTGA